MDQRILIGQVKNSTKTTQPTNIKISALYLVYMIEVF